MPSTIDDDPLALIPDPKFLAKVGISPRTGMRHDADPPPGWPKVVYQGRLKYRRLGEAEAYLRSLSSEPPAKKIKPQHAAPAKSAKRKTSKPTQRKSVSTSKPAKRAARS